MIKRKLLIVSAVLALMVSFNASAEKPIYKWKDNQGNIKYTQSKPPRGTDYETIYQRTSAGAETVNTGSEAEQSSTTKEDNILTEQAAAREQAEKANAEIRRKNCQIAKNNAETLENNQRIMTMVDGKETMLSGEDRIARLNEAKTNMVKYCD